MGFHAEFLQITVPAIFIHTEGVKYETEEMG